MCHRFASKKPVCPTFEHLFVQHFKILKHLQFTFTKVLKIMCFRWKVFDMGYWYVSSV